jgi:hypothetical protein
MAKDCENAILPDPSHRIWAISYRHDRNIWFAIVGETLTGKQPGWKGRKKTEESRKIEDRYLVLAIFPSRPLVVQGLYKHRLSDSG